MPYAVRLENVALPLDRRLEHVGLTLCLEGRQPVTQCLIEPATVADPTQAALCRHRASSAPRAQLCVRVGRDLLEEPVQVHIAPGDGLLQRYTQVLEQLVTFTVAEIGHEYPASLEDVPTPLSAPGHSDTEKGPGTMPGPFGAVLCVRLGRCRLLRDVLTACLALQCHETINPLLCALLEPFQGCEASR